MHIVEFIKEEIRKHLNEAGLGEAEIIVDLDFGNFDVSHWISIILIYKGIKKKYYYTIWNIEDICKSFAEEVK